MPYTGTDDNFFLMKISTFSLTMFAQFAFMDVEGTKCVKQMITLLAITGQFIPQNRRLSEQLRKQMLNNYGWLTDVNSIFRMFSWFDMALR